MPLRKLFKKKISELLRKFLGIPKRDCLLVMMALSLSTILLGCPTLTRKEVDAEIWLNTGIPASICEQIDVLIAAGVIAPQNSLHPFGFYRRLDFEKWDFIEFCKPQALNYSAFKTDKLKEFLDQLGPEEPKDKP